MEKHFHNHANEIPKTETLTARVMKVSGETLETEDVLIREQDLEVSVNGTPVVRLCCTPEHLTELVLGRLCTEGIIRSAEEVEHLFICGEGNIAELRLSSECDFQPYTGAEPTCCTANQQLWERADSREPEAMTPVTPQPEEVFQMAEVFRKDGELHRSTSGTHSCYIRLEDGRILGFEDIGRHNALDKAVGAMLLEGSDPGKCMLYTTGRVPRDMVKKAVAARIPVLVSKAVPTAEAVRMAKQYGLTLVCRAWPDAFSIY